MRSMRSMRKSRLLIQQCSAALAAVLLFTGSAVAQPTLKSILEQAAGTQPAPQGSPAPETPAIPEDDFQRGTPRSTLAGFLAAARQGDYARAAEYLDLRRVPPSISEQGGDQLARHLKTVVDRALWIDLEAVSASPDGKTKDGLPSSKDRVGRIETPAGKVELSLQRMSRDDGVQIWKISADTVKKIPELYRVYGDGLLGEYLPAFFFEYEFASVRLWQWIALVALVPLAYLLAWVVSALGLRLLERTWRAGGRRVSRSVAGPLKLALAVSVFTSVSRFLGLSLLARGVVGAIETTLLIIAFTWVASRFLDGVGQVLAVRLRRQGNDSALPLVGPGVRTAKIAAAGIALLAMLAGLGLDVTAVVAGLGVGGIAVALAAQKSIENFFGGLSIFADEPVRVGDLCRFGDKVCTIEEIGLRSTRVRTPDRTLVTIPNAEFSQLQLENLAVRDRFRYQPTIGVRCDTSPDQLRWLLVELRRLLHSHPRVDAEPARVRFVRFGAYSLDVEMLGFVTTKDPEDYLAVAEDLNLRVLEIVLASGTDLAFPTQTSLAEESTGRDLEKTRAAERAVQAWRAEGALPLPRFDETTVAGLRGSLAYPPQGSVGAKRDAADASSRDDGSSGTRSTGTTTSG
jgi:MscS family membrane protein